MNEKKFVKAFKGMLLVAFLITSVWFISAYYVTYSNHYKHPPKIHIQYYFLSMAIFAAEIIVYWRIKNRISNYKLVWAHLYSILAGFVFSPLFIITINYLYYYLGEPQHIISIERLLKFIIYWASLAIGHTCFTITIIKSFKKGRLDSPDDAIVLDGLIEEE